MDQKTTKKYVQFKIKQSFSGGPVPIPKKTIRNLEINLYQEFQKLEKNEQKKHLNSEDLVSTLMFKYLDTMYDDFDEEI